MQRDSSPIGTDNSLTLVIGASGKTGRRVVDRLRQRGLNVRGVSRSTTPAFDWNDRSTWTPALAGATQGYITYYPDLALPGADKQVGALAKLAVDMGVRRLVLLTGRGEEGAERAEEALKASGADWTVLRASWFSQNFSEAFMLDMVLNGEIVLPAGDVGVPFIDADDIADVAVPTLTEPGHVGQTYDLTGPRSLSFAQAAAEIGQATGREIQYVQIPVGDFLKGSRAAGLPDDIVALMEELFTKVVVESNSHVGDGVMRVLGRPAKDFSAYAKQTAASGAWTQPAPVELIK